jgi:hypothetical protein
MGTGGTRVSMAAAGSAAGGGEGFWAARAACECGVEQKRRKEWGNYFAAQRMMVLLMYCILVWYLSCDFSVCCEIKKTQMRT